MLVQAQPCSAWVSKRPPVCLKGLEGVLLGRGRAALWGGGKWLAEPTQTRVPLLLPGSPGGQCNGRRALRASGEPCWVRPKPQLLVEPLLESFCSLAALPHFPLALLGCWRCCGCQRFPFYFFLLLQVGSRIGLHLVPAEGAGRLVDPPGGVCEGAERHHLLAARG